MKNPLTDTNIRLQCNIQPASSCFLFSRFFAILTKLNANDTCVEAPLRQAVGTTSVLAAVRTIGGIYMFGRVMPVWSVVLVEFCFAFFMECVYGSPLSFRLASKNFDPNTTHPVLFETAIICATVGLMVPAMSLIATFLYCPYNNGFQIHTALVQWLRLMCFNFPFAFFTQLFFIQPFVRTIFKLIFARDIKK